MVKRDSFVFHHKLAEDVPVSVCPKKRARREIGLSPRGRWADSLPRLFLPYPVTDKGDRSYKRKHSSQLR